MECITGFKPGDTFDINYALPIAFGSTIDEVTCNVGVAVGSTVTVIQAMTVTPVADTVTDSNWRISATPAETESWPLGNLVCDIKNIIGSDVKTTDTFIISTTQRV